MRRVPSGWLTVHADRYPIPMIRTHDILQQGGLAAAEVAGEEGDGDEGFFGLRAGGGRWKSADYSTFA